MKWGKEPALAGGSSAATMGSPPLPSKSQKGREAEAQGGKKKSKKAVSDALGARRPCRLCAKWFKSQNAVNAHMRVHKTQQKQQAEELASILLDLGQRKLETMEGRETKGDGSALAGGSSAATMGSPPPPSKSQKGREAEAQGGKKKSKKAVSDALGARRPCRLCAKWFKSQSAVNAHMRVHKTQQKQQAEELGSILLDLGQAKLDTTEGRETKGDGSALAGGGASSSAAEAQKKKKIHRALDLNEEAPEDDDNDDKDYLGDNEVA